MNAPVEASAIVVRDARVEDIPLLRDIYAHHVEHGVATFEEVPPDTSEMARRFREILDKGFPYLIAEIGGHVVGYAYAASFRTRTAYRYTVEDSIYVGAGNEKRGIGRALLRELMARCEALGFRQMVAVTGDVPGSRSIAFHTALGFERVGTLKGIGYKHGRWIDAVVMQRALGDGDQTDPAT